MLTEDLRPKNLEEMIGQQHLIGKGMPLRNMLESGQISSMILWGPPGCGKTTFARLIPNYVNANFITFSAVGGSVKDIKDIVKAAKDNKKAFNKDTVLFVDEIHRFNKAQQDAFLPHVEDGTIILVGATTENPGFEVNAPLLSRSQVFKFNQLSDDEIRLTITKVFKSYPNHKWTEDAIQYLVNFVDGDARKTINIIKVANSMAKEIDAKDLESILQKKTVKYDKKGDAHYDTISAFIKSMRGGQPNATLHYLARMINAGEDPVFIARRMVIFASEDIGNAKPNALVLAVSTMQACQMIGLPEAKIILAQCATYLATCPKSIASYTGISEALADVEGKSLDPIPLHLRNAPNQVMKDHGYAKDHTRYPWLEAKNGNIIDQEYMPQNLIGKKYYRFKDLTEDNYE